MPLIQFWWRFVERSGLRPGFATHLVEHQPEFLAPQRLYLVGEPANPRLPVMEASWP